MVVIFIVLAGSFMAVLLTEGTDDAAQSTGPAEGILQPATALQPPIPIDTGVIWHPAGQSYLQYQPFDGSSLRQYETISGIPVLWEIVPSLRAEGRLYHLIWQDASNVLWRSQVNPEGEAMLATIEVARNIGDFRSTTTRQWQSVLIWTVENRLYGELIDPRGRPLMDFPALNEILAEKFDILATEDNTFVMSYVHDSTLFYGSTFLNDFEGLTSVPLDLNAGEWVDDLHVVNTEAGLFTVWTQIDIATPAWSKLYSLNHTTGTIEQLFEDTPVRGIHPVYGAVQRYTRPRIVTSIETPSGWTGAVFVPGDNEIQQIEITEIVGSEPRLWFEFDRLFAAIWSLQQVDDEVYYQYYADVQQIPEETIIPDTRLWMRDGLLNLPQGLVWLLLPLSVVALSLILFSRPPDTLWMLLAYQFAKAIYPATLFALPLFLLDTLSDDILTITLLLIGTSTTAFLMAFGLTGQQKHMLPVIFFCVDTLLCFIMFGAALN